MSDSRLASESRRSVEYRSGSLYSRCTYSLADGARGSNHVGLHTLSQK